ncbi:hypothetical protein [uncultured Cohaesibacter sp.]|uniref:hypothetical protein n=1 Tax=uncultured Cohaesibacter sp. TaxID=1002546 RepID=UPI0029C75DB7|nr:hypothetical protein [uncultured Cohaesibacter sp.]
MNNGTSYPTTGQEPDDLFGTFAGTPIYLHQVEAALAQLPKAFTKRAFSDALEAAGLEASVDCNMARGAMQKAKERGLIRHNKQSNLWEQAPKNSPIPTASPETIVSPSTLTSSQTQPPTKTIWRISYLQVICTMIWVALMVINARLGREIGGSDPATSYTIMALMIILDLCRSTAIGGALRCARNHRRSLASLLVLYITVATPISILSTTTLLSVPLQQATDEVDMREKQAAIIEGYIITYNKKKRAAALYHDEWEAECRRDKCGPKAAEYERQYNQAEAMAAEAIEAARKADSHHEDLPSSDETVVERIAKVLQRFRTDPYAPDLLVPLYIGILAELSALCITLLCNTRKG